VSYFVLKEVIRGRLAADLLSYGEIKRQVKSVLFS